jgi:hypothetical protein
MPSGKRSHAPDAGRRPPLGVRILGIVVVVLGILTVHALSVPGGDISLYMLPIPWLVAGGAWLFLVARAASDVGAKRSTAPRWLIAIALWVVVVAAAYGTDAPLRIRFALSQPAMDALALEMTRDGAPATSPAQRVGFYDAYLIERNGDGVRFVVAGAGFINPVGFAYSPAGIPDGDPETDTYRRISGDWWLWVREF